MSEENGTENTPETKDATATPAKTEDVTAPETSAEDKPADQNSGIETIDAGLEAVYDVPIKVSAVLGTTNMQIHQLLKLGRGAMVELDRKVGEAVDIFVNDRLVARGEVIILDEKLAVTMTEIVKSR